LWFQKLQLTSTSERMLRRAAAFAVVMLPCATAFFSQPLMAPRLSTVSAISSRRHSSLSSCIVPRSTRLVAPVMSSDAAQESQKVLDTGLMTKWVGGTVLQISLIFLFMAGLDNFGPKALQLVSSNSSIVAASPKLAKIFASFFFLFMSLRSRIFSPLDNSRPTPPKERLVTPSCRPQKNTCGMILHARPD
jgi:hypothetical protein